MQKLLRQPPPRRHRRPRPWRAAPRRRHNRNRSQHNRNRSQPQPQPVAGSQQSTPVVGGQAAKTNAPDIAPTTEAGRGVPPLSQTAAQSQPRTASPAATASAQEASAGAVRASLADTPAPGHAGPGAGAANSDAEAAPTAPQPGVANAPGQAADAAAPATQSGVHSLNEAAPLKTPQDLPSSSRTQETAGGAEADPLFTSEVDNGLEQLLSDWDLFKRSGLFGTGPNGREHPLYKKIKDLQIPLLLAGRFEGAHQEVKQSITDYMNGWRYELGIIYEQGETFEHYLRRVIRHIIDLQQRKSGA